MPLYGSFPAVMLFTEVTPLTFDVQLLNVCAVRETSAVPGLAGFVVTFSVKLDFVHDHNGRRSAYGCQNKPAHLIYLSSGDSGKMRVSFCGGGRDHCQVVKAKVRQRGRVAAANAVPPGGDVTAGRPRDKPVQGAGTEERFGMNILAGAGPAPCLLSERLPCRT